MTCMAHLRRSRPSSIAGESRRGATDGDAAPAPLGVSNVEPCLSFRRRDSTGPAQGLPITVEAGIRLPMSRETAPSLPCARRPPASTRDAGMPRASLLDSTTHFVPRPIRS
ncbi:hypothetical protein E4U42_006562 [Claviceps africana]|uniref:Uncharacterized protein n=1 Tax=Claviceps africana TaxID=83212 RepID=A0A8K0J480_9HYPO|nr:hypothetical protein E4U42_006562 [Claviceps africana]